MRHKPRARPVTKAATEVNARKGKASATLCLRGSVTIGALGRKISRRAIEPKPVPLAGKATTHPDPGLQARVKRAVTKDGSYN